MFGTAAAARDLDARLGPMQRDACSLCLQTLAAGDGVGQSLSGAAARFFGSRLVDLVGALRRIGQNQPLVAGDLQKPAADGPRLFGAAVLDAHDAWLERCPQ